MRSRTRIICSAALCAVLAGAVILQAQATYRYFRITVTNCSGEKLQEIDWFSGGSAYPNPHLTSASSNGMRVWGDNADWEAVMPYDGNTGTHAWIGDRAPPYTWVLNLDLGATSIRPDSIRITKPDYTSLRSFQCWATNDTNNWDLFLDTTLAGPTFAVRTFPLRFRADTQAPTAPAGLTAANVTSSSACLYWQASTDNRTVTVYRVYRNGVKVDSTTVTSYAASGLSAATGYSFFVTAADFAGNESRGIDAIQTGGTQVLQDHMYVYDNATLNASRVYPDAFSPAPYFGHSLDGSSGTIVNDMYAAIVSQSCAQERADRRYIDSAGTNRGRTFKLIAYEGGQHVLNNADVINRNAAIYGIYIAYLDSMNRYFDEFEHYCHSGGFGSGGAWGAKETVGQSPTAAHKYRALMDWWIGSMPGAADTTAPSVPSGLAAALQGDSALVLSWTASTDAGGMDGYQVFQNGFYVGYAKSASYTVAGLNVGSRYTYTLKAVDAAGNVSGLSSGLVVNVGASGVRTWAARTAGLTVTRQPGSGVVWVCNAGGMRLEVFTLAGRRAFALPRVTTSVVRLDRTVLPSGMLLLRVTGPEGIARTWRVNMM